MPMKIRIVPSKTVSLPVSPIIQMLKARARHGEDAGPDNATDDQGTGCEDAEARARALPLLVRHGGTMRPAAGLRISGRRSPAAPACGNRLRCRADQCRAGGTHGRRAKIYISHRITIVSSWGGRQLVMSAWLNRYLAMAHSLTCLTVAS
jgi:hypothetical protein